MIVFEWIDKNGNPRRICIGSKKACRDLKPIGATKVENSSTVILTVGGKKFSAEAFVKVDKAATYALVSKVPTELVFDNLKQESQIVKLDMIMLEFKDTTERLSINSLMAIVENSEDTLVNFKNHNECYCN